MGYHILHPTDAAFSATTPDAEQFRLQLTTGETAAKRQAVLKLIALNAQDALVDCLASPQPETVQFAAVGLWECWLNEAGPSARHRLEEGINLMDAGHLDAASGIFTALMTEFPTWAEAINKQATVLFLQGKLEPSIELCQQVVTRKPDHFGAWNGLAICALQREDWLLALRAVQQSLRLQPYSSSNQQLLRLVKSRLPMV